MTEATATPTSATSPTTEAGVQDLEARLKKLIAEKVEEAERPREWQYSLTLTTNAKGEVQPTIKVRADWQPEQAVKLLLEIDKTIREALGARYAGGGKA